MKYLNRNNIIATVFTLLVFSCSSDECAYTQIDPNADCPQIGLNFGDPCTTTTGQSGFVNDVCECIPVQPRPDCPGYFQNGDFETLSGDPNAMVDQDIDLANFWKPLWIGNSLADLFNESTTSFGSGNIAPSIVGNITFAGMWIENNTNTNALATYREGMFNELIAPINRYTGNYTISFDYAKISTGGNSNPVKVGVYGVKFGSSTLPAAPTAMGIPSNLDLFGSGNTVLLSEVIIPSSATNNWTSATINFDTSTLTGIPAGGFDHIMITNSHLPFADFGRMFLTFDNFCLTSD